MATLFSSIPIDNRTNGRRAENFVDRLGRPIPNNATGPIFAFIQLMISLGFLPLLLWPIRWSEFLDEEREVLHDHIDWWRRRADERDARKLDKIANRLKRRPLLMIAPWLAVGLNGLFIATMVTKGTTLPEIWDVTFGHINRAEPQIVYENQWQHSTSGFIRLGNGNAVSQIETVYRGPNFDLYKIWLISLCVAYGVHWYAIRSHATTVQALVAWSNKLAKEDNFSRIKPAVGCVGLNFLWIILGVGLCCVQAWWAIPMVFGGAMQRQYTRKSSPNIRAALASQTREVFAFTRSGPDRTCLSGNCGAILPTTANYCPRCGSHA